MTALPNAWRSSSSRPSTGGPLPRRQTRLYHDTLYASNLPHWRVDRIGSQVAVLRSMTCFWTADGDFGGWEGCCASSVELNGGHIGVIFPLPLSRGMVYWGVSCLTNVA